MLIRFLLGRAGSGKTCRCLEEIRSALTAAQEGPPLVFLAPKQATFQLEQQLLQNGTIHGYSRLQIVSFERLALSVLQQNLPGLPAFVSEEGRFMILRAVVEKHRDQLKIFRSTARLSGFLHEINGLIGEMQFQGISPGALRETAAQFPPLSLLHQKLSDFATLSAACQQWLQDHDVNDASELLSLASAVLKAGPHLVFESIWLDGFAELTPQEQAFLFEIASKSRSATLAFCCDTEAVERPDPAGFWANTVQTCKKIQNLLSVIPNASQEMIHLETEPGRSRFSNHWLRHLESAWDKPQPFVPQTVFVPGQLDLFMPSNGQQTAEPDGVQIFSCRNPESEIILAARTISNFARSGRRYREIAILVRHLDRYLRWIRPVFESYGIPYFLDRRESVAQHPIVELTRSLLRLSSFGFQHQDWFACLKTGLVNGSVTDVLENEALLHGWSGEHWRMGLIKDGHSGYRETERQKLLHPFEGFLRPIENAGGRISGTELARSLSAFWESLDVGATLDSWDENLESAEFSERPEAPNHAVWDRMQSWLNDLELAFGSEVFTVAEWMEIVESGLSELSVGNVPPSLDQVLIGAVDRSRNPDLHTVIVLGFNEGVFPAPLENSRLLSEPEVGELDKLGLSLGNTWRQWIGREQFLAYIACTRARHQTIITFAEVDETSKSINPSVLIGHLQLLFPRLDVNPFNPHHEDLSFVHCSEVAPRLLRRYLQLPANFLQDKFPKRAPLIEQARKYLNWTQPPRLPPELVEKVLGPKLSTSVSQLEQFAGCSYRFFLNSVLRVEEREKLEFEVKEKGTYQHELLAGFHRELRSRNKKWRDLQKDEIRPLLKQVAEKLESSFAAETAGASFGAKFNREVMLEALELFLTRSIAFLPRYAFDVQEVEMRFGAKGPLPPWEIPIDERHSVSFSGVVDRIDIARGPGEGEGMAVVVDYKSSVKELQDILLKNGLQLQLPIYLAMLTQLANPQETFGVSKILPAGMFFASLRPERESVASRQELGEINDATPLPLKFYGRFNEGHLQFLDSQFNEDNGQTSQFKFKINRDGTINRKGRHCLSPGELGTLLKEVQTSVREMGRRIFSGEISLNPYELGAKRACDQCPFPSVCRIEPLAHSFRSLKVAQGQVTETES